MRLIDAHGSYTISASDNTGYSLAFGGGIISVADEVGHIEAEFDADDAHAIDAVPVVRCRECKHYKERKEISMKCCYVHLLTPHPMREHDFCSYGERKDGDGNG